MEQYMIICPECGEGYWVSPMTLKIHCHHCGTLVFHRGLAGFIDWQAMEAGSQGAPRSSHLCGGVKSPFNNQRGNPNLLPE